MNTAELYRQAVKIDDPLEVQQQAQAESQLKEEAVELAERAWEDWLKLPVTRKFIHGLKTKRSNLLTICESSNTLSEKVINSYLNESNTIRKVITYASNGKYE